MAIHERNRFITVYHAILAIILLLAGGGLVGTGIWLQVTDNGGPLNLEYSGDNVLNIALSFGIGSIIVGGFLMAAAVASLIGMSRKCVGATFRIVYILMALVILGALLFIAVVSFIIVRDGDSSSVMDFISSAWDRTVSQFPDEICEIEANFECRGFQDSDCVNCPLGRETGCAETSSCALCDVARPTEIGCFRKISDNIKDVFLPLAITSTVLAGLVLIDIFFTCLL